MVQEVVLQERDGALGTVNERTVEVQPTGFFITIEGERFKPAVTTQVEIESDADTSDTSDQCGDIERQKTSSEGWVVRVQGIVTANDGRDGNLSMQLLRDYVAGADTVSVRADTLPSGGMEIVVANVIITQANDLVSVYTSDTEGEEQAYEFQLQLGEEESDQ